MDEEIWGLMKLNNFLMAVNLVCGKTSIGIQLRLL